MSNFELSPAKTLAREKIRGLWVAIPTPFTQSDLVDEDVLAGSVEYYIEGLGVDGIFCGGVMGEFWALTMAERRLVHETVIESAAGRVPIIAHTGHHVFEEVLNLCAHAADVGIDFAIVMNPYYPPRPSDDLVRHWYERICASASIPILLFNTKYSGYTISPRLISDLARLDAVCGIKNPQSKEHLLKLQDRVGHQIVVTDASEGDWLDLHLNHGFQALMSTPAVALFQTPGHRPIKEYTALAEQGDLESAWEIQRSLDAHRHVFQRWMRDPWLTRGEGVVPIANLKMWLELMGLPQGPVRPPLIPLTSEEMFQLKQDLESLELIGTAEVTS
jgi:4-hydroxy-tetrahydrodipicolinate synthase